MKKKTLLWSLAIIAALVVGVVVAAHFMLVYALQPDNRGKDLQGSLEYMYEEYPYLRPWVDSLEAAGALRDTFIVRDGTRLHACYVAAPAETRATAVIVHG